MDFKKQSLWAVLGIAVVLAGIWFFRGQDLGPESGVRGTTPGAGLNPGSGTNPGTSTTGETGADSQTAGTPTGDAQAPSATTGSTAQEEGVAAGAAAPNGARPGGAHPGDSHSADTSGMPALETSGEQAEAPGEEPPRAGQQPSRKKPVARSKTKKAPEAKKVPEPEDSIFSELPPMPPLCQICQPDLQSGYGRLRVFVNFDSKAYLARPELAALTFADLQKVSVKVSSFATKTVAVNWQRKVASETPPTLIEMQVRPGDRRLDGEVEFLHPDSHQRITMKGRMSVSVQGDDVDVTLSLQ